MTEVHGYCDPRFAAVRDLLERSVASGLEVGASIHVSIDGVDVIDMWAGWKDKERTAPWQEDTIVKIASGTKTVASLAVLMLVERGLIDLDAPVARYWPEFARNGKDKALVRHLVSHTVGLPAWDPPFTIHDAYDAKASADRLAAQAPWWEPGTRGSYHASSFGHLLSELVLRVTGKTLSQFIAEEIAGPLGADFHLGFGEEMFSRVATVYPLESANTPGAKALATDFAPDDPLAVEKALGARTRLGSFSGQARDAQALFNSPEWRRAEMAGSTGHANARGLGRILAILANHGVSRGVKLLSDATIARIFEEQFAGVDSYYLKPIRWGVGYALAPLHEKERGPLPFLRPGPRTCYWYGSGGSLAIADVERGMSLSYVMNQWQAGKGALNGQYYDAIYDAL